MEKVTLIIFWKTFKISDLLPRQSKIGKFIIHPFGFTVRHYFLKFFKENSRENEVVLKPVLCPLKQNNGFRRS
jgi:hypothetical protein